MKKISFLIFIFGFLLFRPYQMQDSGMLYVGDDYSYFAHATSIVFGQFPSYKKEYYSKDEGNMPMHSIGPGLISLPFVFPFSVLDRLTGNSIVQERRADNLSQSWTLYGFVLASMFYFWMGCYFCYKGLRYHFEEYETVLAIFLMVLCQGIPLFAFRRPLFSHSFEFSAVSVLVWWLLMPKEKWLSWSQNYQGAVMIGLVTGLLELVRLNDILILLIWPLVLYLGKTEAVKQQGAWKKILVSYLMAGVLVLGFYVLPMYFAQNYNYTNLGKQMLLTVYSLQFYLERIWHILTGIDWGLIYTAPFILIALVSTILLKFPQRKVILFSLLPLVVNIYVLICWKVQGGWYGYRYFIPMAVPLLIYPFTLCLSQAIQAWGKNRVLILTLIIAILPLLSMLAFEGNATTLTLTNAPQYFGDSDWGNNSYQLNVWKTLIKQPTAFAIAIFKGGPLYVMYCFDSLINSHAGLLARIKLQYPFFSPMIFFRTVFIYFFPLLLYLISRCFVI